MKFLLLFAASLLLAFSAISAVPDYKAFRGTGGITVTSNPPNGTIVFDGSAISAGALPAYLQTDTLTNLAGTRLERPATNFFFTPSIFTNVVYVNATGSTARINGLLLTNAALTVAAGSTLVLSPGVFNIGTNEVSLLRNGVNWHVPEGATIISGTVGEADDIHSMFHDTSGAITSSITGSGTFIVSNDFGHVIELSNVNSKVYFEFHQIRNANAESAVIQNTGGGELTLVSLTDGIYSEGYDAFISSVTNGASNPNLSKIFIDVPNLIGDTNAGDSAFEFAGAFIPGRAYIKAKRARGDVTLVDGLEAELGTLDLGANNLIYSPLRQAGSGILRNAYVYGTSNRTVSLIQTPNNEDGTFATAGTFDDNTFIGPTNRPIATITNDVGTTIFNGGRFNDGFAATNSIRSRNAQNVTLNNLKLDLGLHANVTASGATNFHSTIRVSKFQNTGTGTNSGGFDVTGAIRSYGGVDVINEDITITGGDIYTGVAWADTGYFTNSIVLESGGGAGKVLTSDGSGIGTWQTPSGGGSGGTNFPNVNLLVGQTNLVLSSGVRKSYYQATNGSHGVNFNLAAPESGYEVQVTHTNSSGTDYTVTFFTNSTAATFYSVLDKTNATSWIVQAGSILAQRLVWTGNQWLRLDVEGPLIKFPTSSILFSEGDNIAGTNKFGYNRTNHTLTVESGQGGVPATNENRAKLVITNASTETIEFHAGGVRTSTKFGINAGPLAAGYGSNYVSIEPGVGVYPAIDNNVPLGLTATRWSELHALIANLNQITNNANIQHAIQLPAITTSNIVVSMLTNNYELVGLTNVLLTNLVELATGLNAKTKIVIRNINGSSAPIVWPAFGAQHGYYLHTNGLNDVLSATVAPPGTNTVIAIEADGTNFYPAVTYWRHP